MKSILFNTEMVHAILDGRKTMTRRIVKNVERYWGFEGMEMNPAMVKVRKDGTEYPFDMQGLYAVFEDDDGLTPFPMVKAPYQPGDILYVRETFGYKTYPDGVNARRAYKADGDDCSKWIPSIHMPRTVARIFLRVTGVRVERLQEITEDQALSEGVPEDSDYPLDNPIYCPYCKGEGLIGAVGSNLGYMEVECPYCDTPRKRFANLFNSTLKPIDRAIYGWDANPWVWVIEFERISKEEAMQA